MDIFSMLQEEEEKYISLAKEVRSFLSSTNRVKKRNYFYASEISEQACLRTLVYAQLIGGEEKISGETQRKWDVGKAMHSDYDEYFMKMGTLLGGETQFDKGNIHGRIDNLVGRTNRIGVVELKTMRSGQWTPMQLPPEGYIGQLLIYLWAVAKASKEKPSKKDVDALDKLIVKIPSELFEKPPLGILYIENKDTQAVKEFFYPYEEQTEKIGKLLEIVTDVEDFLAKSELPERKCKTKTDYSARYCLYKDICFTDKTFKELKEGGGDVRE